MSKIFKDLRGYCTTSTKIFNDLLHLRTFRRSSRISNDLRQELVLSLKSSARSLKSARIQGKTSKNSIPAATGARRLRRQNSLKTDGILTTSSYQSELIAALFCKPAAPALYRIKCQDIVPQDIMTAANIQSNLSAVS